MKPVAKGETYPIFNKYPKFIVDYQTKERERIRHEELDYLRERFTFFFSLVFGKNLPTHISL